MFVAIDGYNLALPHGTGIARYGRNLLQALHNNGHETTIVYGLNARLPSNDKLAEVMLQEDELPFKSTRAARIAGTARQYFSHKGQEVQISGAVHDARARAVFCNRIWNFQNLFRYSAYLYQHNGRMMEIDVPGLQIMHWTYPVPIRVRNCLNLYTIHDVVPLKFPNMTGENKEKFYRLCQNVIKNSDRILTVSEQSKMDIELMFDIHDNNKIKNTYQSFHFNNISHEDAADKVSRILGLRNKGYFIFYGAWEPKKNIGRMIRAYLASKCETPLIIVGTKGWGDEDERQFSESLHKLSDSEAVKRYDYIPDDLLNALIKAAKGLIFPSLYEGFGLPVLEAMAAGTAVITSRTGSIPEIAGGDCLLIDPYDVDDMRDAIVRLDSDVTLRQTLEAAGPIRAAHFNSVQFERRLRELYAEIL